MYTGLNYKNKYCTDTCKEECVCRDCKCGCPTKWDEACNLEEYPILYCEYKDIIEYKNIDKYGRICK